MVKPDLPKQISLIRRLILHGYTLWVLDFFGPYYIKLI